MTLPQSILVTLSYHSIFSYPLTREEIHTYLIGKRTSTQKIDDAIKALLDSKKIGQNRELFYIKGQVKIARLRLERRRISQSKLEKAKLFANLLKIIPTVKLTAISGALAMNNSHQSDDIDLVIICARGSLWKTRFLANIILFPFKRQPNSKKTKDRACLNLFLEEGHLAIKPKNVYTAHEICQMRPLLERDKTYSRFIQSNSWVKNFLPNWRPESSQLSVRSSQKKKPSTVNYQLSTIEIMLKKFQLSYMRGKISNERIGDHQLFFHPTNNQEIILSEYRTRLHSLKIDYPKNHVARKTY